MHWDHAECHNPGNGQGFFGERLILELAARQQGAREAFVGSLVVVGEALVSTAVKIGLDARSAIGIEIIMPLVREFAFDVPFVFAIGRVTDSGDEAKAWP